MPLPLVYALHGFLGQASDWDGARAALPAFDFIAENLFSPNGLPLKSIEQLGINAAGAAPKKILVGYSLGGRLGLQLLEQNPEAFNHFIFVSANPGLPEAEREARLAQDQKWAQKLTAENWAHFLSEWNAQGVFQGSKAEPLRQAKDYDLAKLRAALDFWSLGRQKDFSDLILRHRNKITWVVGQSDAKYTQLAEDLKRKRILLDYKRISGGHRLWLDNPGALAGIIQGAGVGEG